MNVVVVVANMYSIAVAHLSLTWSSSPSWSCSESNLDDLIFQAPFCLLLLRVVHRLVRVTFGPQVLNVGTDRLCFTVHTFFFQSVVDGDQQLLLLLLRVIRTQRFLTRRPCSVHQHTVIEPSSSRCRWSWWSLHRYYLQSESSRHREYASSMAWKAVAFLRHHHHHQFKFLSSSRALVRTCVKGE